MSAGSSLRCMLFAGAVAVGCAGPSCGATGPAKGGATTSAAVDDGEAQLKARLEAALRAKGQSYVPRTRHKNPDGSPKYTNRLIFEASPYLLQHAHNPVSWFAWGQEAFDESRKTGKPIFLSVGYSTCHWCHVMEEESFEDEEIARFLNEHFVPIKVDREERADVDAVYMTAVLSFTGRGGWPMSVWLTPDREPFFAGTYFPPRDGVRGTRHGFLSILKELSESYSKDPQAVIKEARTHSERLKRLVASDPPGSMPSAELISRAVATAKGRFDSANGGMRGAPKFPSSFPVRLLLRYACRAEESSRTDAARMAYETLDKMRAGGIYDHVGGGFHRYATDARWRVPHFEKMLYDNALLASTYLEGGQSSGQDRFFATARAVLDYLLREMRSPEGLFYAATDADSPAPSGKREEGWFFTWTRSEVESALDGDAEALALAYFDVTPAGNLDGRTVLAAPRSREEVASSLGFDAPRFDRALAEATSGLFTTRSKRPPPLRDDKAIVAWNALVVSALARAAILFGDARYGAAAVKAATFLVSEVRANKPLSHAWVGGAWKGSAFVDDLTALVLALLDVLELTADPAWLRDAEQMMEHVEKRFSDRTNGGYFLTADDAEALLVRDKPADDSPIPSGSSMAALAWLRLGVLSSSDRFRPRAETTLRAFAKSLSERPGALETMLCAVDFATDSPKEIVIVVPAGDPKDPSTGALRPAARPLIDVLKRSFVPSSVLVVATEAELSGPLGDALPWAKDKLTKSGRPTAYVCERGACKLPVTDPDELGKVLAETKPY